MVVWYRFAAKYDEPSRASATGLRGKTKTNNGGFYTEGDIYPPRGIRYNNLGEALEETNLRSDEVVSYFNFVGVT